MPPSTGQLRATAFTHQGAVRTTNEDTIAVGDWVMSAPMAAPAAFELEVNRPVICLVADGMGGHAAGEVASRTVAEHLAGHGSRVVDEAALADLIAAANAELFELMRKHPAQGGMGTTVVGVVIGPSGSLVFNVGDSRVYRILGSGTRTAAGSSSSAPTTPLDPSSPTAAPPRSRAT